MTQAMPTSPQPDARIDRLYALLPAIYRMRDAGQNYKLQALLRVIAEQVNLVEDDIAALYDNWFIETGADWVVPYLADLLGVEPVADPGQLFDAADADARALARVLVPRREVANTIHYRRRKGSLALLENLARDVANWPARAQEFYRLLGWQQNLNHQHLGRARTLDVHDTDALDLEGGPFQRSAHTVDVRRISDRHQAGLMNPAAIGLYVWRLQTYSVSHCAAYCHEKTGPHCFTFSVLGQDAPLFTLPQPESSEYTLAGELNLPVPIRRLALERQLQALYGAGKSLAIYGNGWGEFDPKQPLPPEALIVADLSDWAYVPPLHHIAVDPVLGRFAFPPTQLPRKGVRVCYQYGFSSDIGGGEYRRTLHNPASRLIDDAPVAPTLYRVGKGQTFHRIADALARWRSDLPPDCVIELTDSAVYTEPLALELPARHSLQIRAANHTRPVLRLLDWQTDSPDSFQVSLGQGSHFVLDGLLVTGCSLHVQGLEGSTPQEGKPDDKPAGKPGSQTGKPGQTDQRSQSNQGCNINQSSAAAASDECGPDSGRTSPSACVAGLVIRHCTLVPGWGLECDCGPKRPAEPSLELVQLQAAVCIEHSILGSIVVQENEVLRDPLQLCISDSIVDATERFKQAIGGIGAGSAFVTLTILRSTVFGYTQVHAVKLAQDTIFTDCLHVNRRQLGCMRFCYVKPGCRTPRRYHCQPDLVFAALDDGNNQSGNGGSNEGGNEGGTEIVRAAREREAARLEPQFTSERYGMPGYAQLGLHCADELKQGAESESEMGVFHELYQPQRLNNLQTRLDEYTAAGMQAEVLLVN